MRHEPRNDERHSKCKAVAATTAAIALAMTSLSTAAAQPSPHEGPQASAPTPETAEPREIDPYRPMTEEELAELTAYNQATYPQYYAERHPDSQFAAPFWPGDLMWFVGKTALQFGLQQGFGAALERIMPGRPDPTADALEQISDQLDGLRDQIQGVSDQVSALGDQVEELKQLHEWSVYFDRERDVETHKANVDLYADLVAGYERHDQWDEHKARAVASVMAAAVAQMEVKLVNGTDPAFQNLQKVLRYSPSDTRWAQIDGYRRSYEAVLATAVLNIMAAHDKYPDLFQSELDAAVTRYERTIDALYETGGIAYPQPMQFGSAGPATPAGGQLHPMGASYIVASPDRPVRRGESKQTLQSLEDIQSAYQAVMDDYYRGKSPDDTSFGSYLRSLGFSSAPIIEESVQVVFNGAWRVLWEYVTVGTRSVGKGMGTATFGTEPEAQAYAASRRSLAVGHAPYKLDVEVNAGGHAIATDPDAFELAVEGVPIDWAPENVGAPGEMGSLLLEHYGYDALVFVDAVTGQRLGIFNVSQGPIEHAEVESPPSGILALVLGESVTGAALGDGYVVPAGSTLITLPESHDGHPLSFRPLRRALERLNIVVNDFGSRTGGVFVDGPLACGREKGTHCTLMLDPYAGSLRVTADGGPYMVLRAWGGACVGGRWNTCEVDPSKGEQTLTATFESYYPR